MCWSRLLVLNDTRVVTPIDTTVNSVIFISWYLRPVGGVSQLRCTTDGDEKPSWSVHCVSFFPLSLCVLLIKLFYFDNTHALGYRYNSCLYKRCIINNSNLLLFPFYHHTLHAQPTLCGRWLVITVGVFNYTPDLAWINSLIQARIHSDDSPLISLIRFSINDVLKAKSNG